MENNVGSRIKMFSFTLDCIDAAKSAKFYAALLDWKDDSDGDYAWAYPPGGHQGSYPFILFQSNPDYIPPVWPEAPEAPDAQQQMAHLDFAVDNLENTVKHALSCGARLAETQYSDQHRVMLDPDGHPFCLCLLNFVFDSEHYALL